MAAPVRRYVLRADIAFEGVSLFDAWMQLAEHFQEMADKGEAPVDWFEGNLELTELPPEA